MTKFYLQTSRQSSILAVKRSSSTIEFQTKSLYSAPLKVENAKFLIFCTTNFTAFYSTMKQFETSVHSKS